MLVHFLGKWGKKNSNEYFSAFKIWTEKREVVENESDEYSTLFRRS